MISHKKKFIFIHIPKTGGSSVSEHLKQWSADKPFYKRAVNFESEIVEGKNIKHAGIDWFFRHYEKEMVDNYFKFSIVRNPFDRIVSRYFFEYRTFDKKTFKWLITSHPDVKTQVDRLTMNGKFYIDRIIRFENLHRDFSKVCKSIGIDPPEELPKENFVRKDKSYMKYFEDKKIYDLVVDRFKKDFNFLGYEF